MYVTVVSLSHGERHQTEVFGHDRQGRRERQTGSTHRTLTDMLIQIQSLPRTLGCGHHFTPARIHRRTFGDHVVV